MLPWWRAPARVPDDEAAEAARRHQAQLTKPPGSLGRLEAAALHLAALQGVARPCLRQPWITVFAADHGVAEEGVSAFPQAVTRQMLANFVQGGAAIAVLAREVGACLEVVDMGTLGSGCLPGVIDARVGPGTANLVRAAAMCADQREAALLAGRDAVRRALAGGADLFIGGEMGIGNTTPAAALACALLRRPGRELAGPGTGLDSVGVAHKAALIDRALALHGLVSPTRETPVLPELALTCVGGFEIAALAGAYIACAQAGLPALVDGFIAGSAALAACRMNPGTRDWLLFSHASAEPGHVLLLAALRAQPLLDLELRLGEGSGAAVALPLLRLACALHNGMATFAQAGVDDGH